MSDCVFGKLSRTFSKNPTSTPARVFQAPLRWKSLSGRPIVRPAPWGTLNGTLRFPFARPWTYAGTRDICLDFDFTGGVLGTLGAWPETSAREYPLDGYTLPPLQASASSKAFGKSLSGGGCVDSKASAALGGYTTVSATTYSLVSQNHPGKFSFDIQALFTAVGKTSVHAWSLGGSSQGTVFPGVSCNKLYVDLAKSEFLVTKVTAAPHALVTYQLGPFPYSPAFANLPVWLQAAWSDSAKGSLKLTSASRILVPRMPPSHLRSCLYQPVSVSKRSAGIGPSGSAQLNPIWRFVMQ